MDSLTWLWSPGELCQVWLMASSHLSQRWWWLKTWKCAGLELESRLFISAPGNPSRDDGTCFLPMFSPTSNINLWIQIHQKSRQEVLHAQNVQQRTFLTQSGDVESGNLSLALPRMLPDSCWGMHIKLVPLHQFLLIPFLFEGRVWCVNSIVAVYHVTRILLYLWTHAEGRPRKGQRQHPVCVRKQRDSWAIRLFFWHSG